MEALDWLFQQFPSYQVIGSKAFKPTLENSHKILEYLDHPEKSLKFVHVAGSNGKGSVSSFLASVLTEAGLTVGLFTSPHIVHFSERIRVNGKPISDDEVTTFVHDIQRAPLSFSPSFFEITFGMALQHFEQEKCDICIIETGLGGRLDATNVITPELSIITSISLEHTDMLGDTIEKIAQEKAGIIKSECPVIVGKGCINVFDVFSEKAREESAPIQTATPLTPEIAGYFKANYQKENFACVLEALKILPYTVPIDVVQRGIANVSRNSGYSGRLQVIQENPTIIFDVAHNADGIKNTLEVISEDLKGDLYLIYGSSKDKDLKNILPVFPKSAHILACEFTNSRSLSREELQAAFDGTNFKSIDYFENAPTALLQAKERAKENDTIVALGSFFLLSDFF